MNVLIDSDILIEILRSRDSALFTDWRELVLAGAAIFYSPISAAEIWAGARTDEHMIIRELFHALNCVPIDHSIGELAGEFLRLYGKSHSLKIGDALIAASTHISHSTLWTRNRKHYPMKQLSFY